MLWLDKTHPNAGNTIGNNNLLLMDYSSDLPTATSVTVSSQLATEMPHDGPSLDTTMASEEEMDREASSYTLPGEDAEHRKASLEKVDDVPLEEVSDKQPPIELEHEKTLPNKGTSGEITRKTSSPDANHEDTENGGELRYISKYLVQFVPNAKPKNKEKPVRISGARVLTSDTCASLLKEREEKKQKENEEKEKRKLLREQKKKEKEEELRKKAAAEEKKTAAVKKKAAAAQKKASVAAKRAAKSISKSAVTEKSASTDNDITLIESEENQVTRKRQASS